MPFKNKFDDASWNDALAIAVKVVKTTKSLSAEQKKEVADAIRNNFISKKAEKVACGCLDWNKKKFCDGNCNA